MVLLVVEHRLDAVTLRFLRQIAGNLVTLIQEQHRMSAELDRLIESVTNVNGKADSLIATVNGLAQIIRDNVDDRARLTELADSLDAQATEVQDAIDANPLPGETPTA